MAVILPYGNVFRMHAESGSSDEVNCMAGHRTSPGRRHDGLQRQYGVVKWIAEGKHFRVTEDAKGNYVEHMTRTVHQTARHHFNGKTYVLVSGENPVPSIEG